MQWQSHRSLIENTFRSRLHTFHGQFSSINFRYAAPCIRPTVHVSKGICPNRFTPMNAVVIRQAIKPIEWQRNSDYFSPLRFEQTTTVNHNSSPLLYTSAGSEVGTSEDELVTRTQRLLKCSQVTQVPKGLWWGSPLQCLLVAVFLIKCQDESEISAP